MLLVPREVGQASSKEFLFQFLVHAKCHRYLYQMFCRRRVGIALLNLGFFEFSILTENVTLAAQQ